MGLAKTAYASKLYDEIETTSEEYFSALLEIVRGFRHGVLLKPAEDSLRQGMKEALSGNIIPVSELWRSVKESGILAN